VNELRCFFEHEQDLESEQVESEQVESEQVGIFVSTKCLGLAKHEIVPKERHHQRRILSPQLIWLLLRSYGIANFFYQKKEESPNHVNLH